MKVAEFDKFAEEYLATHKSNLAVTGERPDSFARYKIVEVARRLRAMGVTPQRVLDFGCGIGNSAPHLREAFPDAQITAVDVSEKSLSVARARFPGAAEFVAYDPKGAPPGPADTPTPVPPRSREGLISPPQPRRVPPAHNRGPPGRHRVLHQALPTRRSDLAVRVR